MISKIAIRNYRLFEHLDLEFDSGVNVIVGDNDAGKSTLIEAINLALTGRVDGRMVSQDFPPFLVNLDATAAYIESLKGGTPLAPPEVIIDLFFDDDTGADLLRGTNNIHGEDACGIRIRAAFSDDYNQEYTNFIAKPEQVHLVPTEYYRVEWLGFSGNTITARSVPANASVIDPSLIRLQSGTDYYLQNIIKTHLEPKERVELSRAYRSLRETFSENPSVKSVNDKLSGEQGDVSDRTLSLSIDISQRYTWEGSLAAHLDELPFAYIGKGEQNCVKTLLALGRKAADAHIVLIEEPENHLSFTSLRRLIGKIEAKCKGKQVIIATHSSFVLNKLGLQNLILLSESGASRLTDLPEGTVDYFKKLPGFDTLRVVLAKRVMLVEGPSDELIVQRAYLDVHGRQAIDDGIDIISVRGLSFSRFLDLAVQLGRRVSVVRDNDGKPADKIRDRYRAHAQHDFVSVHVSDDPQLKTLEPQIAAVNDLQRLNTLFGTSCRDADELVDYMADNKTTVALAIFEAADPIVMPEYVRDAVAN
jgi:putative ATP-dependent endonuclease of OLD family